MSDEVILHTWGRVDEDSCDFAPKLLICSGLIHYLVIFIYLLHSFIFIHFQKKKKKPMSSSHIRFETNVCGYVFMCFIYHT